MHSLQLCVSVLILSLAVPETWALSKTRGTPLGGMGTGYVLYNAVTGDFAASGKVPPAGSDRANEFTRKKSVSSGFHFFAGGKSLQKASTVNEDAKCPLYSANFGTINDVEFTLDACSPVVPGDNPLHYQLATSPLAFFEITATNRSSAPLEVAAAMEFANSSASGNLLGGADSAEVDLTAGSRAITFSGTGSTGNAYLVVDCDGTSPAYSAGGLGSFLTDGTLSGSAGNLVAAKCTIAAGGTVRFKFVLSWWRTFVSTVDRYGTGKPDEDNYYYHNFYTDSKQAAAFGMTHFDLVVNAVRTMVTRVMGSSFPEFYKEKLLNNLYPPTHNAVCTKDGRVAFWEGHYAHIGIIDQAQHAALWYTWNWPQHQWNELQYWYRTAHRGVDEDVSLKGQIHHDFNTGEEFWSDESRFMCPWDNYLRDDYWYHPNTTNWADLNMMAIFKTYELMLATGNLDSMNVYVPKAITTADRLLTMCSAIGKHIPMESRSTYDTEGDATPNYLAGLTLATLLVMEQLTTFTGDTLAAKKYREWYVAAREECAELIYTSAFCSHSDFAEGDMAGYSWANYFCLEPIMNPEIVNEGCKRLWQMYGTQKTIQKKLGRWHFYTCDHWGGTEIARGNPDSAMTIFKWDYDFFHATRPEMVFWQDLWADNNIYSSYLTAPSVWRSYFQMTGYLLDNANKRLWLRPRIPASMEQQLINAPLLNPACWGNLQFDGRTTGASDQAPQRTQHLVISYDSLVTIGEIILANNSGTDTPYVLICNNGVSVNNFSLKTEGSGLEKNIRLTLALPLQVGPAGLQIDVYTGRAGISRQHRTVNNFSLSINSTSVATGHPIVYTTGAAGPVTLELLSINGARIGTIMQKTETSAGIHTFTWNGKTTAGERISSNVVAILRLASPGNGSAVSKRVVTGMR